MDFPIVLKPGDKTPIYRQLAQAIREAILSGRLQPGAPLPSTWDLATDLGVARSTVVRCYNELLNQSYIKSVSGVGTFVNEQMTRVAEEVAAKKDVPKASIRLSKLAERLLSTDLTPITQGDNPTLNFGAGPPDLLPLKTWRQLLLKHCRVDQPRVARERFGYRPLREAVAGYLRRSRAVRCTADNVAVFPNCLRPILMVADMLADAGDAVAVENPGFPWPRRMYEHRGLKVDGFNVDDQGIMVSELRKSQKPYSLIYVTPSHHDPTGAVMSMPRRQELLDWAEQHQTVILEDDYDSEYRYGSPPVPCLQGMDPSERTIYYASFWKLLSPLVNCGYLVLPDSLIDVFEREDSQVDNHFSMFEQLVLTDFINEGHLEQQIKRTRQVYQARLQTLIFALTKHFGANVQLPKESAGTQMTVRFNCGVDDLTLLKLAQESGVLMSDASPYFCYDKPSGTFLMAFGHITESEILAAVEKFAAAVHKAPKRAHNRF